MGKGIILLGSNIEPAKNIRLGASLLAKKMEITKASHIWQTPPIGTEGPVFYNAAVLCDSTLDEIEIKSTILRPIEEQMGRIRTENKYEPRTIDLDCVILYGEVIDPHLWDTAFILLPTAELVPYIIHPESGFSLNKLAEQIQPDSGAVRLDNIALL